MNRNAVIPTVLAVTGFAAIVVGITQGVLQVAPGYHGTINAGAEGFNRRDWLLAGIGIVGIAGTIVSLRKERLSAVPVAVGGVVLFEAFRTMILAARGLHYPLYTETTYRRSGDPVKFVFGAEPFLLVAGGVLLVGAGFVVLRGREDRENGDEMPPSPRAA